MIVRPKTNWFRMLFAWEGSVQNTILAPLGIILVLSLLVLWGHHRSDHFILRLSPVPFSLIGVALAIFASFRNSACYERYWEGRKLWGQLTGASRCLARFAVTVPGLPVGHPEVRRVVDLLAAFAHTLRHQLRGTDPAATLARIPGRCRGRRGHAARVPAAPCRHATARAFRGMAAPGAGERRAVRRLPGAARYPDRHGRRLRTHTNHPGAVCL
jgi:putative membrane protein